MQRSEFIHVRAEVKALLSGEISGYAGVFDNVDLLGDILKKGCFADSLTRWASRGTFPRLRWTHGESIGHTLAIAEDDHGLTCSGRIWIDDDDIAALYQSQVLPNLATIGMSFAFIVVEATVADDVRTIIRLELQDDITLSFNPVNTRTGLTEAKGLLLPTSVRRAEGILRDAGFSKAEAKAVLSSRRDAGVDDSLPDILTALREANASLSRLG